ncbi:hypothetical protein L218DRAFT_458891 [Marasmius fiardii PR-910]|nr:hypothetical protein L218DRAFT_458891 [Marasmius fiardii PR-910]
MEKAAGALPIPGLAAIFFLTSEIIRSVDDTRENKKGFKLLAGEANALAHTLWEECAEIQMDERRASLWQSLEPHINKFTDILESIRKLMERKHGHNFFVGLGNSKKDSGFIQEFHNELKAAVDQFNVAMQVANRTALDRIEESQSASGEALNRIETLLLRMQETSQELESIDTRLEHLPSHNVGTGAPSMTGREVVQPSIGRYGRTRTLESTSSDVPYGTDVVMPGSQVLLPFLGEQVSWPQTSSQEHHAEHSMPDLTNEGSQLSPIPVSRVESSPASLPSTNSTNSIRSFPRRLDHRDNILTDGSLTPRPRRPQVEGASLGPPRRTSTVESTPSHVPHHAYVMPIPQVPPSGDPAPGSQSSRATFLQEYDPQPEFPMPSFPKRRTQSPIPISRAESLPASLPSTYSTNSTDPVLRHMNSPPSDALTDGSLTPRPQVAGHSLEPRGRMFTMDSTFLHSPVRATPHSVVMPIPKIPFPMPEIPPSSIHSHGDPASGLQSSPSQARASVAYNGQSVHSTCNFNANYRSESPVPMENRAETSPTFSAYRPILSSSPPSDTHDPASQNSFLGGFNPNPGMRATSGVSVSVAKFDTTQQAALILEFRREIRSVLDSDEMISEFT